MEQVEYTGPSSNCALSALVLLARSLLCLFNHSLQYRLSNREIASALHLSEATVKTHIVHVLAKLGLRDRVQIVVMAYETGLVEPGRQE